MTSRLGFFSNFLSTIVIEQNTNVSVQVAQRMISSYLPFWKGHSCEHGGKDRVDPVLTHSGSHPSISAPAQPVPPHRANPFSGEQSFTIENNPHLKEESQFQLWSLGEQWDRAKPTDVFHQLRHSVHNSPHRHQSTLLPEAQQGTPLWYPPVMGNLHFFQEKLLRGSFAALQPSAWIWTRSKWFLLSRRG